MDRYNNQFALTLPDGWLDQSSYTFVGPQAGGIQHLLLLNVDNFAGEADLLTYAYDRIEMIKNSMPDLETLKEGVRTLPSGLEIYEWVFKWTPPGGDTQFRRIVYMLFNKVGYIFAATFTRQTFKVVGVEVMRMIENFVPGGFKKA